MSSTASVSKKLGVATLAKAKRYLARKQKTKKRSERVHLYKRGRIYWVNYTKEYKQRYESLRTDNYDIALTRKANIEMDLINGQLKTIHDISMDEFIDEYMDFCHAKHTKDSYMTKRLYIMHFVKSVSVNRLKDISRSKVSMFFSQYVKGRSKLTYNHMRSYLHAMMNYAIRHGYIRENPIKVIEKFKVTDKPINFIETKEDIDRVLNTFKGDILYPYVATAVFTGMRRTEMCWLTWDDIDFKNKIIHVRPKTINGESWEPKTKKSRIVPISEKTGYLQLLVEHFSKRDPEITWVFPSPEGYRWNQDNVTHRYNKIRRKANLPWTILDLRHTFGSQLVMRGVSLYKVSTLMGNSPEICRKHYAALMPQQMHGDVEF